MFIHGELFKLSQSHVKEHHVATKNNAISECSTKKNSLFYVGKKNVGKV